MEEQKKDIRHVAVELDEDGLYCASFMINGIEDCKRRYPAMFLLAPDIAGWIKFSKVTC